jgi:hypothetical protein
MFVFSTRSEVYIIDETLSHRVTISCIYTNEVRRLMVPLGAKSGLAAT